MFGDRVFGGTVIIKMGNFYVVNGLQQGTIIVSEGAGSAFSLVKSIPPGQHHVMRVDSQATYREILLALDPGTLQAKFSSDDCQECDEVRITGTNASELLYVKVPKNSRSVSGITSDANLSNFFKRFGIGRRRPSLASQSTAVAQPAGAPQQAGVPQLAGASHPAAASQSQPVVASAAASQSQPAVAVVVSNRWNLLNWRKRPPKAATFQLAEASQMAVVPPDSGRVQLAEASSDGSNTPTGSSVPDGGSAQLPEASQTNGEIETDGAGDQAKVPVI